MRYFLDEESMPKPRRIPGPRTILHEIVAQGADLSPATRERYVVDLDAWIAYAGVDPRNWTRNNFASWYASLLDRMRAQSANRMLASIAYASRWYAIRENNPSLDFALVQKAKADERDAKHALTVDQARSLLDTCADRTLPASLRDFALIVLGLETGMRRMSLISARLQDVTVDARVLPVFVKGGGKRRVDVPLSATALAALRPWALWLGRAGIRSGALFRSLTRVMDPSNGLFVWRPGANGLTAASVQKILRTRSAKIGFHVHPHLFRHTFVTWRVIAGCSPIQISAMTGHKISGLAAMPMYMDMAAIAEEIRNSTPAWLQTYVGAIS